MIDVHNEQIGSLTEAAKWVPRRRGGRPCHVSTLWRWARRGIRGVKLETIDIGGTSCTSREALDRFYAAVTALRMGQEPKPLPPPAAIVKRTKNAIAALQKAGILESTSA